MAFKLITADGLGALAGALTENLYSGNTNVLERPKIVVQSKGMERWLSLEIADRSGVVAGLDFLFLNGFFEDVILQSCVDAQNISVFSKKQLTWIIFKILQSVTGDYRFRVITHYIGDDQLKRLQIAQKLAELYDKYSLYRADWLLAWERCNNIGEGFEGSDEEWLGELWRLIREESVLSSFAESSELCLQALHSSEFVAAKSLPASIHIFGVSSLPPRFFEIIDAVASWMDIYFYYLEVSSEYWGLVRSEKELLRRAGSNYEVGNTLLAALGGRNRDFFNLLVEYASNSGVEEVELDPANRDMSLLGMIQQDIKSMSVPDTLKVVADEDRSIEFHACYGKMRQVEALYNSLLIAFSDDPDLRPKDILVLTPAIKDFVPYIRAVFGTVDFQSSKYIPFTISDRAVIDENKVCQALFSVLRLFAGRFKVSEVWALFNESAFEESRSISGEDKEVILQWLKKLNVHWGLDASQREQLGGTSYAECSWQEAEERLLLGYALSGDPELLFTLEDGRSISGVDVGGSISTLKIWFDFLASVFSLYKKYLRVKLAEEWVVFTGEVVEGLFAGLDVQAQEVLLGLQEMGSVFKEARVANDELSADVFLTEIENVLSNTLSSSGFIMGGVTFCQFQPMRNIPAKIICMLGMDDGTFPRIERPLSFDIATQCRRLCDPSLKQDDQGVFLETLLSVSDKLRIFYTGNSVKSGDILEPASPVVLLQEYVRRYYDCGNSVLARLVVSHPLQSFSRKYFLEERAGGIGSFPLYSNNDYNVSREITESDKSVKLESLIIGEYDVCDDINNSNNVALSELEIFYKNPCKWFLSSGCGVRYGWLDNELPDDEDQFELGGGYSKNNIKEYMLQKILSGVGVEFVKKIVLSQRDLPLGEFGDDCFDDLYREIEPLVRVLDPFVHVVEEPLAGILAIGVAGEDSVHIGEIELNYELATLSIEDGVAVQTGYTFNRSITWSELSVFWLRHLVYSVVYGKTIKVESRYFSRDGNDEYIFGACEERVASKLLGRYLYGFYLGQRKPLAIFRYASTDYALALVKGIVRSEALSKAEVGYIGSGWTSFGFDSSDDNIVRCFGDNFTQHAEYVVEFEKCCERYVLPLFSANLNKKTGKKGK